MSLWSFFLLCSTLFIFFLCARLKDSWNLSPGLKELYCKHYSILTTANVHLFYQKNAQHYKAKHDDVFVVSAGRSGTNFLNNLVHQLRTGGDDTFVDVMNVGRFFNPINGRGSETLADEQPHPRLFWSHAFPWQLPENSKVMYIVRDPVDQLISWYTFILQLYEIQNVVTIEEVYINCVMRNCFWPHDSTFLMTAVWWRKFVESKKYDNRLLWLNYNDATNETGAARERLIRTVANFTGVYLTMDMYCRVKHRVSHQYYLNNAQRFSGQYFKRHIGLVANMDMKRPEFRINTNLTGIISVAQQDVTGKSKPIVSENLRKIIQTKWFHMVQSTSDFDIMHT